MPNLRGASPVGRVRGGRSYAARMEGNRWSLRCRRVRGRPQSGVDGGQRAENAGWVH